MSKKVAVVLPVGAKWQWYSDKGWVPFAAATAKTLEVEYAKKSKKVKVDAERFVDFDFKSEDDIRANFINFEKEKNLVGVQRRYDDLTKRRAVRREAPQFFKKDVIFVSNPEFEVVQSHGAEVAKKITSDTTLFICLEDDAKKWKKEIESAKKKGIPVVNEHYLIDALNSGSKPASTKKYVVEIEDEEEEEAPKKKKSEKRKSEDSDDDDKKDSKKKKSSSSSEDPGKLLQPDSKWMGVCSYKESGEDFPFELMVLKVVEKSNGEKTLEGTVKWPTLDSSKTKFRGSYNPDKSELKYQEYEIIKGEEHIEVPVNYRGSTKGSNSFVGKVELKDLEEVVTFKIDFVKTKKSSSFSSSDSFSSSSSSSASSSKSSSNGSSVPDEEPATLDGFKAGRFSGKCMETASFVMTITSRSGSKLEGKLKTDEETLKFKGEYKDKKLTFTAGDKKYVADKLRKVEKKKKGDVGLVLSGSVADDKSQTFEIFL